jgi:dextranase
MVPSENEMNSAVTIQSVIFTKSFFKPGEKVEWTIGLQIDTPGSFYLDTTITLLDETLMEKKQLVELPPGFSALTGDWDSPEESGRGYGLNLRLETLQGGSINNYSTAFDVLESWTQNPRYGFMTDFHPGRKDGTQALDNLLKYHINGLQFYDWMYRHDQYLTPDDPYIDPLGRRLSINTVKTLIREAHQRGMVAMPYTAVYAASIPFFEQHPDWALYRADGNLDLFGDNFLVLMDPRPESPWSRHLLDQFRSILSETDFDGIHLDQYGSPKVGFDVNGNSFPLDQPLADMINATRQVVNEERGNYGYVVFNAVTNWPIETVAPSKEDLVYIEVWPPYISYNDLFSLVIQGQTLGGGKPVVIAAYIDPAYEVNARLMDAILFSAGAGHIELGEQGNYLAEAYFPNFKTSSMELSRVLQSYYDFAVRYENVIGPQTHSANKEYANQVAVTGWNTSTSNEINKIMPVVRSSDQYLAISLVNMLGLATGEWAKNSPQAPTPLSESGVRITGISKKADQCWFASPDKEQPALVPLPFDQQGDIITLKVPYLYYWDMILIDLGGNE